MHNIETLLYNHNILLNNHINKVNCLLESKRIINICAEFDEYKANKFSLGFNVFALTSDIYYRENYHSDIIKSFLDPKEKHNQDNLFLNILIDMLNQSFSDRIRINKKDYLDAETKREVGRLDILIYSQNSRHCIIIENKINNASDMPRQLPRYYDYMISKEYEIDAIIYLPLQQTKRPDTSDWSQVDKDNVTPILCHLPAYSIDGSPNLVDNWILPCSVATNDIDCHSILRQYGSLVKSLNHNMMDKIIITKFYESLLENNNIDTALSIRAMLDDVPVLMADRLYEKLLVNTTFGKVWNGYKPNFCGIIFQTNEREYKIDTYSTLEGYEIYLFPNEADRTMDIPWSESLIAVKNGYRKESGEYFFKFPFNAEDKVISFIHELLAAAESYNRK